MLELDEEQVLWFRARRGHLAAPGATDPADAARALLGAQSQQLAPSLWALAMRTRGRPTAAEVASAAWGLAAGSPERGDAGKSIGTGPMAVGVDGGGSPASGIGTWPSCRPPCASGSTEAAWSTMGTQATSSFPVWPTSSASD